MVRDSVGYVGIAGTFAKVGVLSFGGWSTTALLLDNELVLTKKLTDKQLDAAVASAQILPGATQVAIVANIGYQLRGVYGAVLATASYLLPATCLIVLFAAVYFGYLGSVDIMQHFGGLIAALAGIILANAYQIGRKHAVSGGLWLLVGLAFVAKLWFDMNAVLILLSFGFAGLLFWFVSSKRVAR